MCAYYSQWAHDNLAPRSQEQWYSFKFCRAVKSRRINGTTTVPLKSGPETIGPDNVHRAREIFGRFITQSIDRIGSKNPMLVPIPSKDGLIGAASFRSLDMVKDAMANQPSVPIVPALRFTTALQPANAGGPRGRHALAPYMRVVGTIPHGDIILVDDIITTGGSLLAACDKLEAVGREPIGAIVCGHTVSDSLTSAFGPHRMEIGLEPELF